MPKGKIASRVPRQLFTWLACFVVLVARGWPRLTQAHLWAEDGIIFLHEGLELGVKALWQPYAGYFHTLPRLIAFLCLQMPLYLYAFVTTLISFALYAFVFSEFSTRAFAWIVPNGWWRLSACILMCMAPGLYESLGNLTNLHTGCFIYLCLIAMQDITSKFPVLKIIFMILCAGTEGSACVILPAYLTRLVFLADDKSANRRQIHQHVLVASAVTASFVLSYIASFDDVFTVSHIAIEDVRRAMTDAVWLVMERFVAAPLLGPHLNLCVQRSLPYAFWFLVIPPFSVFSYHLINRHRRLSALILVPCASVIVHYLLMWTVRPGSQELFHMLELIGPIRHSLASAPLAIVFIYASIASFPQTQTAFLGLYFWLSLTLSAQKFSLGPMQDGQTDWQKSASAIERAKASKQPLEIAIPIAPRGFILFYKNDAARNTPR